MRSTRPFPSKMAQSVLRAGVFGNAMAANVSSDRNDGIPGKARISVSREPPRFLKRHGQEICQKVKLAGPREPDQRRDLIANPLGDFARVCAAPGSTRVA